MRIKIILVLWMLAALSLHGIGQQTAEDWLKKGDALYDQGNYTEAIRAYDEAITLDPEDVYAWYNKGWALYSLGNYTEAIQAFDEAIRLDPEYAGAWTSKGIAFDEQGNYTEAIQCY